MTNQTDKLTTVIISPGKYVQGRDAIWEVGEHISVFGKKVFVFGGKRGLEATREGRTKSLAEKNMEQMEEVFKGESSQAEVDRLMDAAKSWGADMIMANGGGKTIDTAKIVAAELGLPTIVVPTTASTDAPCSRLALIYTEEGEFVKFYFPPRNPDVVLVDTSIIAKAPVRTLVAGMGDAFATWFEADACKRSCAPNLSGTVSPETAQALARLCFDILMEYGLQAKMANEMQVVTPAFEKVVEANTYLSGIGFESGGLAAAHSMQDGFTVLEEIHQHLHGEKVAFLTLIQLVMESRSKEVIQKAYEFCYKVGLPITLDDLHIGNVSRDRLMKAVEESCLPGKIMYNHAFPITPQTVFDATIAADAMGKAFKKGQPIV